MFEDARLRTADLAAMRDALARLDPQVPDAERIDQIRLLEELKAVAAAAQLAVTAAFISSQRAAAQAEGIAERRAELGLARQVALARRISPHRAQREVGWACILTTELPRTFAALRHGRTSERRALVLTRETAWLPLEHRLAVDAELGPRLESLGDRAVEGEARRIGYRLDPAGAVERIRHAEKDRRVGLRPAPDSMVRLTALLPVAQGVACYAALVRAADGCTATGDERGRGQLMADTLVERITGRAAAADVPVEVHLVITDEALLGGGDEPAEISGHGPIPAGTARRLITDPDPATPRWVRRLYRHPRTGDLVALESRRRLFTAGQRRLIELRDQRCRTPWCDAPIRHIDHIVPFARQGPTTVDNGQGYCAACNYAKEAPGWNARIDNSDNGGRHRVVLTTPTGHEYESEPPLFLTSSPAASATA
jgi:hypothetical protein